jgi:hypothetical protein
MIPYVEMKMDRKSSAFLLCRSAESSSARFTSIPPKLWHTHKMGFSVVPSLFLSRDREVRSVCACWWILSELMKVIIHSF